MKSATLLRVVFLIGAVLCLPLRGSAAEPSRWGKVPPVDFSKIKLDDFTDDELDLPFYLHHFHTVANAVEENGSTRGFMTLPVWRGRDKNQQGPHNARVMESHLTLAFFYCTDRPWNPYFGDKRVRDRLEAMLTFWCDMQHEDGRFSEYKPQGWNLPATAFGTKFMGQTLTLLKRAGDKAPIDPALHQRVIAADRKAIMVVLTRDDLFWDHAKRFTNQYTNVFAGAAAYLTLFPEEREIPPLLEKKFAAADRDFRSPCGYWYEADGPDFGYTLHTHHSNARMTYARFGHGTPIGDLLEKQEAAWNDWLGYNMLREPGGSTFVFNRGIQTRQQQADWPRQDGPFAEHVESARAFATTREERAAWISNKRAELSTNWGKFPELIVGDRAKGSPVSPYTFLHREHKTYYPGKDQRETRVAKLPYLARNHFTHQRVDPRRKATFTFVRRASYYATFNSGPQITAQQRLGLGMFWNPQVGTLLQSQTATDDHAWGTRAAGADAVYEAGEVSATYTIDGMKTEPAVDAGELPSRPLVVRYHLGAVGQKTVIFEDDHIAVSIEHPGGFTEQIPLVVPSGPGVVLAVDSPAMSGAQRVEGRVLFNDRKVETLSLPAKDSLTYRLQIRAPRLR